MNKDVQLNKQQEKATKIVDGPLRIIAGAGTGKTRTIVARTVHLINKGVDPKTIVLLTFTRKAAEELKARCKSAINKKAKGIFAGTFHSFCIHQFSKSPKSYGLSKNYSLLDRPDQLDLIKFLQEGLVNKKELRVPASDILDILNKTRNLDINIKGAIKEYYPDHRRKEDFIRRVINEYEKYKSEKDFLDYDDILFTFATSIGKNKELKKKINAQYKYILVDEYQDTNAVQERIIKGLAGAKRNVAVVGDDFQSIYAFRGARVSNILDFNKTFPNCTTIKLEKNYRSTQGILDLANEVVSKAKFGIHKKLKSNETIASMPKLVEAQNGNQEARVIADFIVSENRAGVDLKNIAILMRQAFDSLALQGELNRRKIPYILVGGQKLSESAHVKDLLAVAKFGVEYLDEINIIRFLSLLKGIGGKNARKILDSIADRGFVDFDEVLKIAPKAALPQLKKVKAFCKRVSPEDTVEEILTKSLRFYKSILVNKYDNHKKRLREIEAFIEFSSTYRDLRDLINDNCRFA